MMVVAASQFLLFGAALAASDRCVVIESEKSQITLKCKKEAKAFQPGTEVKIKSVKRAAVEGC